MNMASLYISCNDDSQLTTTCSRWYCSRPQAYQQLLVLTLLRTWRYLKLETFSNWKSILLESTLEVAISLTVSNENLPMISYFNCPFQLVTHADGEWAVTRPEIAALSYRITSNLQAERNEGMN
jgi:hypothetical protein